MKRNPSQDPTQTSANHKKRASNGRTVVVGAAVATAALLAACSPGGGGDEATPRATSAVTAESTTTTNPAPTPEEIKAFSDGVERNKFNDELQKAKKDLGNQIIEMYHNGEGNSSNNFYEFKDDPIFPEGYGALNVFIDVPMEGNGVGEYGLVVMLIRNPDGTLNPDTIDSVSASKIVNNTGLNGSGADRHRRYSVSLDSNYMRVINGDISDNVGDAFFVDEVTVEGGQRKILQEAAFAAQTIITDARAHKPIN